MGRLGSNVLVFIDMKMYRINLDNSVNVKLKNMKFYLIMYKFDTKNTMGIL